MDTSSFVYVSYIIGILLVSISGIAAGSGAWPFKVTKEIRLEIYLFVWALFSLVLAPWLVTFCYVPDIGKVASEVGWKTLLLSNALSCSWGIANVLYMICVMKIGAALTGAILGAVAMAVGMITPLVIKGSGDFRHAPDLFSPSGLLIVASLVVIIIGIALITAAGIGRERALAGVSAEERKKRASGSFLEGLLLVTLAGILSTGLSLSFVYSQNSVVLAIRSQGVAGIIPESFAPWAFCVGGGAIVQLLYASIQLSRKKMWGLFFDRPHEVTFGVLAGLQFFCGLLLLGRGMIMIGPAGAAIGFGIQQSLQTIANQMVGFFGGEWKGVHGRPRWTMFGAVAVLLIAVSLLTTQKALNPPKDTMVEMEKAVPTKSEEPEMVMPQPET